jgi:hypothetical protein
MPAGMVVRLHSRRSAGYTDTTALNDIHALLTTSDDSGQGLPGDIAAILTRTGRPMVRSRDIEASTGTTRIGWPVARVQAGDTTVTVRQDPAGPGLLVKITTRTAAERDGLTVSLNGRRLHRAQSPGGHTA